LTEAGFPIPNKKPQDTQKGMKTIPFAILRSVIQTGRVRPVISGAGRCFMAFALGLAALTGSTGALQAGLTYVPNRSFETPPVPPESPYATPDMDSWQKTAQPFWYDPTNFFNTPWEYNMGTFTNVPFPGAFIDNCAGTQAAFVFGLPGAGIFQDFSSLSGTNVTPSHAFNAKFNDGRSYDLTVAVIGGSGNMPANSTLDISLYYRDASNNLVTVATTTITNTPAQFPTNTHFVDFNVHVPTVSATDAWAGRNIGVMIASSIPIDTNFFGGYWDVDNVRLVEGIAVPNFSFESPRVPPESPYAGPDMDSWQKTAQPFWYDPTNFFNTPWVYNMGTFTNVPFPGAFIDNCEGTQAAFVFGLPGAGIFQDYNTIFGTNVAPDHAFHARYTAGKAYALTVGVIGGGGNMPTNSTLALSLYYRDNASNMVTVAAATITNSPGQFPTNTHFVDFTVQIPLVQATDAWAGQYIGVEIASSIPLDTNFFGGYWDVDNVRLAETVAPALNNFGVTNRQATFTLLSEPELPFEILATTNLTQASSNWTSLGNITNLTGVAAFTDPTTNLVQRFYRAHRM
jgi:hypothetical protein